MTRIPYLQAAEFARVRRDGCACPEGADYPCDGCRHWSRVHGGFCDWVHAPERRAGDGPTCRHDAGDVHWGADPAALPCRWMESDALKLARVTREREEALAQFDELRAAMASLDHIDEFGNLCFGPSAISILAEYQRVHGGRPHVADAVVAWYRGRKS